MVKHIHLEGLERSGDVQHKYACFIFPTSVFQMMPREMMAERVWCTKSQSSLLNTSISRKVVKQHLTERLTQLAVKTTETVT